jgi:hypothetical protein
VALLRGHAKVLLAAGFVLAVIEQAVLYGLRVGTARPPYLLPYDDRLELYWLALSVGFATEIAIITALGGLASQAAGPALLGERARIRVRGGRFGPVALFALAAGVLGFLAAIACLLPWFLLYALIGLAVPALVIDRISPARAVWRSVVLSCRGGLRGAAVRIAGYVAWGAVRVALGIGTLALINLAVSTLDDGTRWLIAGVAWAVVNTVAYPVLACLDAVLHLETRIRTEGLDIELSRARATGRSPAASLVVR